LPKGLLIHDVPLLYSHSKAWTALPAKPQIDCDRRRKRVASGKPAYIKILEWRNRELSNRFSDALIALIRSTHARRSGEGWAVTALQLTILAKRGRPLTKRISLVDNGVLESQGTTLGQLRPGLSDEVEVTTRRELNGTDHRNLIARTHDYLINQSGEGALALIDYDRKGMPLRVAAKVEELGGLWPALASYFPNWQNAARVVCNSTSAGLFRCLLAGFGWLVVGAGGQLLDRSILDRVVGSPDRLLFHVARVAR
jgi:hypothetical protein